MTAPTPARRTSVVWPVGTLTVPAEQVNARYGNAGRWDATPSAGTRNTRP